MTLASGDGAPPTALALRSRARAPAPSPEERGESESASEVARGDRPDGETSSPGEVEGPARGGASSAAQDVAGAAAVEAARDEAASGSPATGQVEAPSPTPVAPRVTETDVVRVAVGLAPEAPGSTEERRLVDALVENFEASRGPRAEVRRLRSGAATARRVCAEGQDDLVITVGYLPDRPGPAVFTRDCALERELGVRRGAAASTPGLLGALWDEREAAIADGAQVRTRPGLSRRAKTGLIAGGALLAIGLAVGIVLSNTLREDVTVITVSP